ncbi:MAG: threonine--tRNA ligase [Candidatus Andersenbacteria bacterium]|nr:threonine--tRNA ligase [Candidatus Andersenbacteria bacterium]MBI3250515.1 threonine--tRNA ligase [Candidatus Andersenbacteria bacterium]
MAQQHTQEELDHLRHSAAHLLAAAVLELWPDAKPTIGPAIEDGFYYDFEFSSPISEKDFKAIEKKMTQLLADWKEFTHKEVTATEAKSLFADNIYKTELVDEIAERGEKITLYTAGTFTDLCRGGHVAEPRKQLQYFKLLTLAGAYWRGDEKNAMLTRIYGTAFPTKDALKAHLVQLEEAKKRDHRKLGKELDLFAFSPLVGPGLPMFTPRGTVIREELLHFVRRAKEKRGYSFVTIPHIAKTDLYIKSGHLGKYDAMMPIMKDKDGNEFVMKAMNCPHHFELFNSRPHSYRDLPLRFAENTAVYRNEKSGELSGLVRVAALTQDDTHHFVRHDQIQAEIEMILGLMKEAYNVFGFKDYHVQISIRDPKHSEKYFGDDAVWKKAETILVEAVKAWGAPYLVEEGEAAFYGPKIDIMVKDAIGRMWQLTTVQLDFVQAENFQMRYTGQDGQEHAPAVLHVAILGSVERFMGILIEHYAGALPLWLSPVQVAILPISDDQLEYAKGIAATLKEAGIRVETDERSESIGKKIREAQTMKVPVMLIVGKKEVEDETVAVRLRAEGDKGAQKIGDVITTLTEHIRTRS